MNALKLLAAGTVLVALGAAPRGEDKNDFAKLLIGKWEVTKADPGTVPTGSFMEFTKDGKFLVTAKKGDEEANLEGSYTVDKNTFTFMLNGKEQTITITKISEKEMSTKDKDDKVVELARKK